MYPTHHTYKLNLKNIIKNFISIIGIILIISIFNYLISIISIYCIFINTSSIISITNITCISSIINIFISTYYKLKRPDVITTADLFTTGLILKLSKVQPRTVKQKQLITLLKGSLSVS
jgi:hypothetical protein